ncbi:MAG TPA: LysO family transporter [Perlabentimonas sp.]|nr:LysO family transporter [Tenuifilaceae bacterium]HZJ73460.1 LysO family transporter [Perlabentimonas sp.]
MFTVLIVMVVGVFFGYFLRNRKKLVKFADKFTMWAIYLLLFLLGIAVGANEIIMKNLPRLGLKALIISLGGIAGSVLLAWAAYVIWFKPKNNNHEG